MVVVLGMLAVKAAIIAGPVYIGVRLALRHGPLRKNSS
jgi:hypothetical protein